MTIELRLSDVDPPAPEPKRTIYRDIANLPDPTTLGITARYFNHDDVGLYFQITGSGTGYTFGTVNLGLLGSGANTYKNLDQFASKTKPSAGDLPNGEMEENITLTLKAYTDSGYSTLKWTYERIVTVHWINSADIAFTVDELDNFDDGTVQGWAVTTEIGGATAPILEVVTDYVLSAPYSIRMRTPLSGYIGGTEQAGRLYKSFATPNKDVVYAIMDIRTYGDINAHNKYLKVNRNGTTLVYLGQPYDGVPESYFPKNKWMRIVVPLPKNLTIEMRIIHDIRSNRTDGFNYYGYLWLDDFRIISK